MEPYVQTIPTCILGESPHWNAEKQELIYVDITGKTVHRYVPRTGEKTQVYIESGPVSPVIPVEGEQNKYVVGVGNTLQLMEWDGKSSLPQFLTTLQTVESDRPGNRFNDGKCDSNERLWIGTMNDLTPTEPVGNLYKITNNVELVQSGIRVSNGLCWNKENNKMFYIDTRTFRVDVFDFDNQQGAISNRRTVYDFEQNGERGRPDGMTIDEDGNLWVACFDGFQIIQIDPNTGRKLRGIDMPVRNCTAIAFGGENLDVMYVTSATHLLTEQEKLEQPSAGTLFQITNVGVKGQGPGNNFRLQQ